jgi:hypothetical protein
MQARRLPAARGTYWLFEGFRLFRRNPPLITALTLLYLLIVQALTVLLPGIGPILLPLFLPFMTLIVANGCRLVDEGLRPSKATLLRGLAGPQGSLPILLRLGVLQLAGAILLVLANALLNGGADPLAGLEGATPNMESEGGTADGPPPGADAAALGGLLRMLLLALPLVVAFWFAPFLAGWDRAGPLKALFFSIVASWRNLGAMAMFSLAALFLAGIVPGFILVAISQVAGVAPAAAFVALRLVLVFLVAPVLTASVYVSYRDIFHSNVDESA